DGKETSPLWAVWGEVVEDVTPILAPSVRGALLACSLRRGLDRVRSQLVEGLNDQRGQRQRVGLGWVLAVGTGDHDHSRCGRRPRQAFGRVSHGRGVGRVATQPARGGEIYARRRLPRGPLLT